MRLYLEDITTPEIAARTYYSKKSVDRYIDGLRRSIRRGAGSVRDAHVVDLMCRGARLSGLCLCGWGLSVTTTSWRSQRGADVEAVSFLEEGVEPSFTEVTLEIVSMLGPQLELNLIVGRRTVVGEVIDGAVESSGDFEADWVGVGAHGETENAACGDEPVSGRHAAERGLSVLEVCRGDLAGHERISPRFSWMGAARTSSGASESRANASCKRAIAAS